MRKLTTITLSAQGVTQKMEKGKFTIEPGKQARNCRLKVSIPVANTTGSGAALSDTQKQTLLSVFLLTVRYGANGSRQPYQAIGFDRIQREFRYASNSEIEGYSDTSTGLGKTVANGATNTLVFYLPIPLGLQWWMGGQRNFWGMGPSQASTFELEIRRSGSDTIATGWAINGSVSIDVIPDIQPVGTDRWSPCPEYVEQNETDKTVRLPDGLPLRISERTAVHASSTLTNVSVFVGDLSVHDQVSPSELISQYNDSALLSSAGLITDRETLLLSYNDDNQFSDLPTGAPRVVQNVKDLATFQAGYLYCPVVSAEDMQNEIRNVAWNVRKQRIRAVSLAAVNGLKVPDRLLPFVPFCFFAEGDPEFEQFPGIECAPGAQPFLFVPPSVKARASQMRAAHQASGAARAAEEVVRQVAAAIPGAVQGSGGFDKGSSPILAAVRAHFS